ncbi:MAG: mCpol domain-containing protein [Bacteroidia bacterium]|nr:mCpol domain-containing protein [Bacteroidia bacterium]
MNKKFAFFDGDNVGITIEKYLTSNNLVGAQKISTGIKIALGNIEEEIKKYDQVRILIIGGDDILIEFTDSKDIRELIARIRKMFEESATLPMSCGIGCTIKESIYSLYLAKLFGKDQIIEQ